MNFSQEKGAVVVRFLANCRLLRSLFRPHVFIFVCSIFLRFFCSLFLVSFAYVFVALLFCTLAFLSQLLFLSYLFSICFSSVCELIVSSVEFTQLNPLSFILRRYMYGLKTEDPVHTVYLFGTSHDIYFQAAWILPWYIPMLYALVHTLSARCFPSIHTY